MVQSTDLHRQRHHGNAAIPEVGPEPELELELEPAEGRWEQRELQAGLAD